MIQRWNGMITVLTPLAHNSDESLGVDTKFRRIKIRTPEGDAMIPVYSGNAFRGRLRRLAAADFLERIGIGGTNGSKISDKLYYCMFSGGSLQKGSTSGYIDVGAKRELRANIPFLSIFGTAFHNQMLAGKLSVGMGIPVVRETAMLTGVPAGASVWDIVDEVFYTRRDDLEDKQNRDEPQQMRYTVECMTPGAIMAHEFLLTHADELETSCFGAIMRKFDEEPLLGGKGGIGHGRIRYQYDAEWPSDAAYTEWITAEAANITTYVRELEARLG